MIVVCRRLPVAPNGVYPGPQHGDGLRVRYNATFESGHLYMFARVCGGKTGALQRSKGSNIVDRGQAI